MGETRVLKPVKGVIIRDPVTKVPLSEAGQEVPWTGSEGTYWRRRVQDGSAILVEKKSEPAVPVPPSEEKEEPEKREVSRRKGG